MSSQVDTVPIVIITPEIESFISPSVKSTLYEVKNAADTVAAKSQQIFHDLEANVANIPIDSVTQRVYKVATNIEKVFNVLGCIPFIGAASGSLRTAYGYLQAVGGAALAAIGEVGVFVCKLRHSDDELQRKWKKISILGAEQILHGCLNIIRGSVETLLGYYSLGLANIILLMPNVYKEEAFSPYFDYGIIPVSS